MGPPGDSVNIFQPSAGIPSHNLPACFSVSSHTSCLYHQFLLYKLGRERENISAFYLSTKENKHQAQAGSLGHMLICTQKSGSDPLLQPKYREG